MITGSANSLQYERWSSSLSSAYPVVLKEIDPLAIQSSHAMARVKPVIETCMLENIPEVNTYHCSSFCALPIIIFFFWIHTLYTHYIPLQYSSHHSYKTDVKVLNKLIDMIWIDLDIYIYTVYIYPINYPMKHNVNPALVNPDYFIGRLPKKKLFKWVLKLENCLSISLKKNWWLTLILGFHR